MTKFLLKLIIVTSLTWLASPVLADWTDIEEISISKSRPLFDRTNRVYVVNVQIQNDSDEDIQGPLRMLVKNATIEVTGEDGLSESGAPYFVVSEASLPAGQSVSVKTTFEPNRARLAFDAVIQKAEPNVAIYAEAEGGGASTLVFKGNAFSVIEGDPSYVTINETDTNAPTDDARVIELEIAFPEAGEYTLYARVRVGPNTVEDDSFFLPTEFGRNNGWETLNNISGFVVPGEPGYEANSLVISGGSAASNVWKWTRIAGPTYTVPDNSLDQVFRFAGREDGLAIDKFAFAKEDLLFTIEALENGRAGNLIEPPPPFVPAGPPLATGQEKFLGGVCCGRQRPNFEAYWNQVTPENAGKWGSVEGTRDVMNWAELDEAYELAKANNFPYKHHVLVWGNQQPEWITDLPAEEQLEEILEWFNAVNARYEAIDFIEVVNEFDNDPPNLANDGPGYIDALRLFDPQTTSELISQFENNGLSTPEATNKAAKFDWIINAFQMARNIFPSTTRLMFNEYNLINSASRTDLAIELAKLLQARGLLDDFGFQGHAFSTTGPNEAMLENLDRIASETGLDVYVTELDIDGPTELIQLLDYQRIFPLFWEHPAVKGITMWGYLPGHWRENQGAILAVENGSEKPALKWLRSYMRGLSPTITNPGLLEVSADAPIGTSIIVLESKTFDGVVNTEGEPVTWSILGGSGEGEFTIDSETGEITTTENLRSALRNLYVQVEQDGYTSLVLDLQIFIPGDDLEPVVIEYDFLNDVQGWRGDYGTGASVGYDEAAQAAVMIPDWAGNANEQVYIREIALTDLTDATVDYSVTVSQTLVDAGLTIQGFIQTGAPSYTRIYGEAFTPVAGENTFRISPLDNGNGDIEIIERIGFQLNGPLTGALDENVLLNSVIVTIPVTVPASNVVEYDFEETVEGWQGEYGTTANVVHNALRESAELLPNGSSALHNYIVQFSPTDYTGASLKYTVTVTEEQANNGLTVQGYVQTGAPSYTRLYGNIQNVVPGENVFTFTPVDNGNGDIANVERIAFQINGSFSGASEDTVLLDNVLVTFP